jgi:hypothetical protein
MLWIKDMSNAKPPRKMRAIRKPIHTKKPGERSTSSEVYLDRDPSGPHIFWLILKPI